MAPNLSGFGTRTSHRDRVELQEEAQVLSSRQGVPRGCLTFLSHRLLALSSMRGRLLCYGSSGCMNDSRSENEEWFNSLSCFPSVLPLSNEGSLTQSFFFSLLFFIFLSPQEQRVTDLLWSDPTDNDSVLGVVRNDVRDPDGSGRICKFGPDRVHRFLAENDLQLIIRWVSCSSHSSSFSLCLSFSQSSLSSSTSKEFVHVLCKGFIPHASCRQSVPTGLGR